jgi:pyruvate dehydrogenase E2 component (dihydrolipoamide acetyltransferase)
MPVPIIMPKFGFTLETCDIVQWLKADGDTVRAGDPICEVTTDKVNMEVEAPEDGTLIGLRYKQGDTVPVTEVIAYLLRPGEARPADLSAATQSAASTTVPAYEPTPSPAAAPSGVTATPVAQRLAESVNLDLTQVKGTGPHQRITRRDVEAALAAPADAVGKLRATPAARYIAEQHGVDLTTVTGTGPRGRIQAHDVQAARQTAQVETVWRPPTPSLPVSTPVPTSPDEPTRVKLEGMRRTIALRLQKSFQTAPHIFFEAQVETTAIDALRARLKARNEKLSVTALLVKVCASVLLRHSWLNATIDGEEVALWPTANIGMAVALDAGLIVPVIHHAERRSLREIQTAVDDLAGRARSGALKVPDMIDGTFTISNLGMYGVDRFTAIINPPQVGILAVGRTQRLFVPDEHDQPVLRSFMSITLSADHRVVDGAQAAQFIQDLRQVLEEPALISW